MILPLSGNGGKKVGLFFEVIVRVEHEEEMDDETAEIDKLAPELGSVPVTDDIPCPW